MSIPPGTPQPGLDGWAQEIALLRSLSAEALV